jgi:hypothetical protein
MANGRSTETHPVLHWIAGSVRISYQLIPETF